MAGFSPKHKAVLDGLLLGNPHVRAGKMFGFPAYCAGRKLCICLYEQGVAVKLPEGSAARLLREDAKAIPFQPMGRPRMRGWVQINLSRSEEYSEYQTVFEDSISHVLCTNDVLWKAPTPSQLQARFTAHGETSDLEITVDGSGRPETIKVARWGNPEKVEFHYADFGVVVEGESTFGGYTIPTRLRAGWYFGTARFELEGEFFRATITEAEYR